MRISPLEPKQASWSARLLFAAVKRQVGKVLTPLKVQAHRPGIMWGFAIAGMAVEFSKGADKIVKRLVTIRTAQIVGCPF
jgi:hypothetical protein